MLVLFYPCCEKFSCPNCLAYDFKAKLFKMLTDFLVFLYCFHQVPGRVDGKWLSVRKCLASGLETLWYSAEQSHLPPSPCDGSNA